MATEGAGVAQTTDTAAKAAPDAATNGGWPEARMATPGMPFGTDYAALRQKRMAEVSEEMREIYEGSAGFSIRQFGTDQVRAMMKNPAEAVLAPGVKAWNIEIPGPGGPIPTRVYMPEGVKEPVGVYLSTHAGGWMFGEGLTHIDTFESQCVLDWGCALVHPDYRVAPEHKFPAAIDDCYAAYRYILEHGAGMGMDTRRIGVGGGCTGANLATVVALMARDDGVQLPAVQYLWSPAVDTRNNYQSHIEFAQGYGLSLDDADFVIQSYLRNREDTWDWRASPVLAETLKGSPPTLIWVGEWEILVGETRLYASRLKDAGVPLHYIEGKQQGHGHIYGRNMKTGQPTEYSRVTMPEINAIMRGYIGPEAADGARRERAAAS